MLIIFLLFLACLIIFLSFSFFKLIKEINNIVSAKKIQEKKKQLKLKNPLKKEEKIFQKNLTRKTLLQLNFRKIMKKIIIIIMVLFIKQYLIMIMIKKKK